MRYVPVLASAVHYDMNTLVHYVLILAQPDVMLSFHVAKEKMVSLVCALGTAGVGWIGIALEEGGVRGRGKGVSEKGCRLLLEDGVKVEGSGVLWEMGGRVRTWKGRVYKKNLSNMMRSQYLW